MKVNVNGTEIEVPEGHEVVVDESGSVTIKKKSVNESDEGVDQVLLG